MAELRAEPLAHETRDRVCLLERLAAREGDRDRAGGGPQALLGGVDRLFPGHLGEAAARQPDERRSQAIRGPKVVVGEPALVAEPAAVDLRMVARQHARHLALPRRRPGVAAHRAEAADRRDVLDLPGARAEAVDRRGERAHGTQLDDVAGEMGAVRLVLERGDVRVGAAVQRHELSVLRDLLGEAGAAVAEDATLAVERDQRGDRNWLVERALGVGHPGRARPVAEGEVLQRALAALVAVGAVEWVVQQDELEHGLLALCRQLARRGRLDHHSVLRGQRAGRLELRQALDLDEAHPAGAERGADPRLVAEDRDLDAGGGRRLDHPGASRHRDGAAVDRDRDELGRAHRCCPRARVMRPRRRTPGCRSDGERRGSAG